jgi:hypothetical protein
MPGCAAISRNSASIVSRSRTGEAYGRRLPGLVEGLLGRHIWKTRVADELTVMSDRQPLGGVGEFLTAHNDLLVHWGCAFDMARPPDDS